MAEVAERCTYEDAEDPFVYPITRAALAQLAQADPAHQDLLVAAYVFKLLSHVGYRPDYSCCVACDDVAPNVLLGPGRRLAVASCAQGVPGCERVDADMAQWLEGLIALRFTELAASNIDPHTAARLLGLAHIWAATHRNCRLRALKSLIGALIKRKNLTHFCQISAVVSHVMHSRRQIYPVW